MQDKAGGTANSGAIRKPTNAVLRPYHHVPEGLLATRSRFMDGQALNSNQTATVP